MEVGECYVNRFDANKVYRVQSIHDGRLYAEQCFCRPDGMEVGMLEANIAYRLKDWRLPSATFDRIRQLVDDALRTCVKIVEEAETSALTPNLIVGGLGNRWTAEPQPGDYIIAYYEEVTTLFHVTECVGSKVSGEYLQIDDRYIEHDMARGFDLPEKVMLVDEAAFAKIPKVIQMTQSIVSALVKAHVER